MNNSLDSLLRASSFAYEDSKSFLHDYQCRRNISFCRSCASEVCSCLTCFATFAAGTSQPHASTSALPEEEEDEEEGSEDGKLVLLLKVAYMRIRPVSRSGAQEERKKGWQVR